MGNQTNGSDEAFHYRKYDDLPRAIKQVLFRSPYDFAISFAKQFEDKDVTRWRQRLIDEIIDSAAREVRRTYGPEHPQATIAGWKK